MNTVRVRLGDRSYPIYIQNESILESGRWIRKRIRSEDVLVVTDRRVAGLYGETVRMSLESAGFRTALFALRAGEHSKSLKSVSKIHTRLIQFGMQRDGLIVALGGGVIGDVAGFVASTYMRGIPFVQIPTTLLAQVDSSVGGKTGINHPLGKNLIGSFYQPNCVLIDPDTLTTLDERERYSGMAEVVKSALIADDRLFKVIETHWDDLVNAADNGLLTNVIARCCRIKADVVEKDETEQGLRRILNFGHTLGHAIEALGRFRQLKHGEAVAAGMRWAVWLSRRKGLLAEKESERILALLERFPVPETVRRFKPGDILEKIRLDKKQTVGGLHLVLLTRIGKAVVIKVKMEPWMIEQGWADVQP